MRAGRRKIAEVGLELVGSACLRLCLCLQLVSLPSTLPFPSATTAWLFTSLCVLAMPPDRKEHVRSVTYRDAAETLHCG